MDTQTARQKAREQERAHHAEYMRHWRAKRKASNVDSLDQNSLKLALMYAKRSTYHGLA